MARWETFEDQVRGIAGLVWRKPCHAKRINGVNFDGVIVLSELEYVIIEASVRNDLDKVRRDNTKIASARLYLASQGIVCRGWIVLDGNPTNAMLEAAESNKIKVCSVHQFAANFFEFP